jgi:holo-[acyl-carrier protein] synthase
MGINNFSVGVDIESIKRFKNLNRKKSNNFLAKIFTAKEMDYCFSKQYPAQHLTARFAGKEAVIKALKTSRIKNPILMLNDIEITNNKQGAPEVSIRGNKFAKTKIIISLSHCEDKAVALALVKI